MVSSWGSSAASDGRSVPPPPKVVSFLPLPFSSPSGCVLHPSHLHRASQQGTKRIRGVRFGKSSSLITTPQNQAIEKGMILGVPGDRVENPLLLQNATRSPGCSRLFHPAWAPEKAWLLSVSALRSIEKASIQSSQGRESALSWAWAF